LIAVKLARLALDLHQGAWRRAGRKWPHPMEERKVKDFNLTQKLLLATALLIAVSVATAIAVPAPDAASAPAANAGMFQPF
jgi:hypothetical protein